MSSGDGRLRGGGIVADEGQHRVLVLLRGCGDIFLRLLADMFGDHRRD